MTTTFGREGLTLLVLLALLGAASCTNSNVISSGRSDVELDGVPAPAAGATYARATVRVAQLSVRPTDSRADQALGDEPIGMIQFPGTIDLKSSAGSLLGRVVLSAGQYRGVQFRLQRVELNRDPSAAATPCTGCDQLDNDGDQRVDEEVGNGLDDDLDGLKDEDVCGYAMEPQLALDFAASDLFVVPVDGQMVLALRVNSDKLVQLLESHCVGNPFTFPSKSEIEAAGIFSLGE